jgi:cell division protease FtsH
MVVDYGMSERIGQVSFNLSRRGEDEPIFDKPYSEATAEVIDAEVKQIIEEARERARSLLREKRDKLDEMAEALLEKEVLGPGALVEILGERPHGEYVSLNGKTDQKALVENGHSDNLTEEADATPSPDGSSSSDAHNVEDAEPSSGDGAR